MSDQSLVTQCHCGDDKEHIIDYKFFDEHGWKDTIVVSAALNHYLPWYKRVGLALKYFLGVDNTYCHYVETVYNKETATKLRDWLDDVIPRMEN